MITCVDTATITLVLNNHLFMCPKDFVLLEILLSLTGRNLEGTYVAFFLNTKCVSLAKVLVGMYVNIFLTWKI
jgi:hypothetical protein